MSGKLNKGYVQVYTGDGKGKTTAAFGLALRAFGAGLKVFIGQFVKGMKYSELKAFEKIEGIEIKQYGLDCFIFNNPTQDDIDKARKGLLEMKDIICSGNYDLVIMDEANIAVYLKLFSVDELMDVIDSKPEFVELVITGRKANPRIIERADLVSEIKEIKHYYKKGVQARIGIES